MTEQLEQTLTEQLVEALEPFAEVYGRRSKLVRGTRGMNQVAKGHRVGLISEQSDGHFGYLPISAFRDAELALDRARADPEASVRDDLLAALRQPGPNVPGCDCDRDGDAGAALCEMHKKRFEPLQWETLAFMVVDLEAYAMAVHKALDRTDPEALLRENGETVRRTGNELMAKRGKGK